MLVAFANFHKIYNHALNYIFPCACLNCHSYIIDDNKLCSTCFNKLNFITKPFCKICGISFEFHTAEELVCLECLNKVEFDLARHLFKFDEFSKTIIHAFKYSDKTSLAKFFAKLICSQFLHELKEIDFITCVPMNRWKRLLRRYNPAQLLAAEIAIIMQKPLLPDLMIKTKWTKSQTSLTKKQREKNIIGTIIINRKYNINKQRILLIDDVMTTKTTFNTCSKVLKTSGAVKVYAACIAARYKG